jgi:Rps23 Pro-64 3,4-dihydroxylase Tpa1-like proline 4-hydroxylase
MNVVDIDFPYDMLVFDDFYNEDEQSWMWNELKYLYDSNSFLEPDKTLSAVYDDGTLKKQNRAVFLTKLYPEEYYEQSALIMVPRMRFLSEQVIDLMYQKNPTHGILKNVNRVSPLVSYYENSDHYDSHYDESAYSTLSYFIKDESAFEGGDITFTVNDYTVQIPVKHNRAILFPSCYTHSVSNVIMPEENQTKMLGRFCVSQFLLIERGS